jgi:hypothetical protein
MVDDILDIEVEELLGKVYCKYCGPEWRRNNVSQRLAQGATQTQIARVTITPLYNILRVSIPKKKRRKRN